MNSPINSPMGNNNAPQLGVTDTMGIDILSSKPGDETNLLSSKQTETMPSSVPEDDNFISLSTLEFKATSHIHFAQVQLLIQKGFKATFNEKNQIIAKPDKYKSALFFSNHIMSLNALNVIKIVSIKTLDELKNKKGSIFNISNTVTQICDIYSKAISIENLEYFDINNLTPKIKMFVEALKYQQNIIKIVKKWLYNELIKQFDFNLDSISSL